MNPVLQDNINRCRLLISGFANKYGKQLDDSYMDTDASIIREAEDLNKQEFMWYESGGNNYISGQGVGTTLHRPGVKAMQDVYKRQGLDYLYQNGIDPLRSAEGRAYIAKIISAVSYTHLLVY